VSHPNGRVLAPQPHPGHVLFPFPWVFFFFFLLLLLALVTPPIKVVVCGV
jgi:hypothetical protein